MSYVCQDSEKYLLAVTLIGVFCICADVAQLPQASEPPPAYFILRNFPTPLLIRSFPSPVYSGTKPLFSFGPWTSVESSLYDSADPSKKVNNT